MTAPARVRLACTVLIVAAFPAVLHAQQAPAPEDGVLPDFDVRDRRPPQPPGPDVRAAIERLRAERGDLTVRHHRVTGGARAIAAGHGVALSESARGLSPRAAANQFLQSVAPALGLDASDLRTLRPSREFWTRDTGTRHVFWTQRIDNLPVFDAAVAVHLAADGSVLRVTSSAVRGRGRGGQPAIDAARAAAVASATLGTGRTIEHIDAALTWFPIDGGLRLGWHLVVRPAGFPQEYDIVVDAESGEPLLRRNRVRYADGNGRVLQSAVTAGLDPRRPDARPFGADGTAESCPPVSNHVQRSLTAPFRDPLSVLGGTGHLAGNNTHVYRRTAGAEGALGIFLDGAWQFDFPFNTADAAETSLFFAVNFAHDFFYDLGFDEAAGNFQVDNFGRGGAEGDPVRALARAAGRNNATWAHAGDGQSPTMSMFLWDGSGCWSEDVDGDGVEDLDGDVDLDIVIHEYHHGVSLRLNTSFSGNEAGAMGEGGGDFFAYSVNGDTLLADYSRPGGIRGVNAKTYADWSCLLGIFCSVHDNGQIWANVLWDARERFRTDQVNGSDAGAIREMHQLYVDGLKLSPPSPTMLDLRDAILQADAIRNPTGDRSVNFCRLWESFARRGMGVAATDTSQNSLNRVTADYTVPEGCVPPPAPPAVSILADVATATEAGTGAGAIRISRDGAATEDLIVTIGVSGTASPADYLPLPANVTIPAGAQDVTLLVTPVDDAVYEENETVTVSIRPGGTYKVGAPASATVTIVSDDVAPDLQVAAISAPAIAAPGASLSISDTTQNGGAGEAPETTTAFYLSTDYVLSASDVALGARTVPALAPGASSQQVTNVHVPADVAAGTYQLLAKVDPENTIVESAEYNNVRLRTIAIGPDLTVAAIGGPAAAAPGAAIQVTDTTSNIGAGDAPSSVTRFYLSTNTFLDGADVLLSGSRGVPSLAGGASSAGSTMVTIPSGTAVGTYCVLARADGSEQIDEASEGNNVRCLRVAIGGDLVVTALSGPVRAAPGATLALLDTTKNQGGAATTPSTTAFYLSANLGLDAADLRLGPGRSIPSLAPGNASSGTTMVVLPSGVAPGVWYLFAKADADSAVVETQEGNNTRFASILVGPDLRMTSVSTLAATPAGGSVTVTDTVTNRGAGTAGPSRVRYYLSTNLTLDSNDERLDGARDVPPLAADMSSTGSTSLTMPANRAPGQYYLLVVADGDGQVAESSETNNVTARGIKITS